MLRFEGGITPSDGGRILCVCGVMHQLGHVNQMAVTYLQRAAQCLGKAALHGGVFSVPAIFFGGRCLSFLGRHGTSGGLCVTSKGRHNSF